MFRILFRNQIGDTPLLVPVLLQAVERCSLGTLPMVQRAAVELVVLGIAGPRHRQMVAKAVGLASVGTDTLETRVRPKDIKARDG